MQNDCKLNKYKMNKTKERSVILFDMGFKFDGQQLTKKTETHYFDVHHTDLLCWSDEKFEKTIKQFKELLGNEEKA